MCNAGVAAPQMLLLTDLSIEDWRTLMDTNLDGAFHILRAAVRALSGGRRGASSPSPPCGGSPAAPEAAYSASRRGSSA